MSEIKKGCTYRVKTINIPETAQEFFNKKMEMNFIESHIDEMIFEIFGCPDEDGYYFFEDIRYDYYDESFEILGVENDWTPDESQLKKLFDFGFSRCWINYTDDTERYCVRFGVDDAHVGVRKKKAGSE